MSTTTVSTGTAGIAEEELTALPAWLALKDAAAALQQVQAQDRSVAAPSDHGLALAEVGSIVSSIGELAPLFPHDSYLSCLRSDFRAWADAGFGVPDFLGSLLAVQPQLNRVNGLRHFVVFPMYTQNGSTNRPETARNLRKNFRFYDWDAAKGEVRWMCSFDTTNNDIRNVLTPPRRRPK